MPEKDRCLVQFSQFTRVLESTILPTLWLKDLNDDQVDRLGEAKDLISESIEILNELI